MTGAEPCAEDAVKGAPLKSHGGAAEKIAYGHVDEIAEIETDGACERIIEQGGDHNALLRLAAGVAKGEHAVLFFIEKSGHCENQKGKDANAVVNNICKCIHL